MTGLRGYDVWMCGRMQHMPDEGDAVDWIKKTRDRYRGSPVFLVDNCIDLLDESVAANPGQDARSWPAIAIPFRRFFIEWENRCEPRNVWERHVCTCEWDGVGRRLFVVTYAAGTPETPAVYFHGSSVVQFSADGKIIDIDFKVAKWRLQFWSEEDCAANLQSENSMVLFALLLLSAKNVTKIQARPPRHLRRRPGAYGDTIGDVHYTLDIPGGREFSEAVEGLEEPQRKRLHIVRGHFADYTEGKGLFGKLHGRYYVAPHVRGSAEVGTVHKDYRVVA